jgi:hypothetical protein
MDKYKKMVNEYCLFDYKWNNNVDKLFSKPFRKFVRADTVLHHINNRIEHIYIDATYGNMKIITLTIYYSFEHDLTRVTTNDDGSYSNTNLVNYLEENKLTVSKFILKISENDNVVTIMNSHFDLVTINDLIHSEMDTKPYEVTVYELIKNIISI